MNLDALPAEAQFGGGSGAMNMTNMRLQLSER